MNSSIVILVIVIAGLLILPVWLGRWRSNRAVRQVMDTFVQHRAIGPKNAKTLQELGLARRGFALTRDYRQLALLGLIRGNAVGQTEDGKLYLTEESYEKYLTTSVRTTR